MRAHGLGLAEMDHGWCEEAEPAVTMVQVVPAKKVLAERPAIFDQSEAVGKLRSCPHGHSALSRASCRHAGGRARIVLEELSGVSERPMIIPMTTTARPQQRYDHRLRDLVQRTGDVTIATDLGVPRSTARGWLGAAPTVVVSLDVADLTEPELRQEILKLRRRVQKLAALLRLALALLRSLRVQRSQESVCRTDAPSCGSCAPWIGPASASRCERSCGSCGCRRVGSMPGAGGRARVRSTISRPVPARHRID